MRQGAPLMRCCTRSLKLLCKRLVILRPRRGLRPRLHRQGTEVALPQARYVALPRDAETDGSAVVHVLGAAEPPGGALRGGATQRVPWQEPKVPAKAGKDLSEVQRAPRRNRLRQRQHLNK